MGEKKLHFELRAKMVFSSLEFLGHGRCSLQMVHWLAD
jgi:hypothetical protein